MSQLGRESVFNKAGRKEMPFFAIIILFIILAVIIFWLVPRTTIVWAQNETIVSGNLTIYSSDFENMAASLDSLVITTEVQTATLENIETVVNRGFEAFVMLGLIFLAFWRRRGFTNILAGVATFFIALSWFADYKALSMTLIVLSGYFFWLTILALFRQGESEGK